LYVIKKRKYLLDRGSARHVVLHIRMILNLFNSSKLTLQALKTNGMIHQQVSLRRKTTNLFGNTKKSIVYTGDELRWFMHCRSYNGRLRINENQY
jgi:hypothetical protein